ncbi:MAG TPA: HEAT repeat domain-containing protein [Gemmataceae bacterium]|nr:HEAT repeat domain-containing protein [Gemmataceae bacterium]
MRSLALLVAILATSTVFAHADEPTRQGKTVKEWRGLLTSTDVKVRVQACQALGDFGRDGKAAVGDVAKLLMDSEPDVRFAAADALRRIGPAAAGEIAALVKAMNDKDTGLQISAIQALGGIGPGASKAAPALCAATLERDSRVAVAALDALGGIGLDWPAPKDKAAGDPHRQIKDALSRAMADPEPAIRLAAIRVWGEIATSKEDRESDVLVPALGHGDSKTRIAALHAWRNGHALTSDSLDAVFLLLNDPDPAIRRLAANGLYVELDGLFGQRQTAAFKPLLDDTDALVRITAAQGLVKVGYTEEPTFDVVHQALKDQDSTVRAAAAHALPRVRREDQDITDALLELCKDASPMVRRVAAETLFVHTDKGTEGIKALVELMEHTDSGVRAEATLSLGIIARKLKWHSLTPALLKALKDKNPTVSQCAAWALGAPLLKDDEVVGQLTKKLDSKEATLIRVAAALALMNLKVANPITLAALKEGLGSGDAEIRLGTLRIIQSVEVPKELAGALAALRDDPSPEIRRLAVQAHVIEEKKY